MLLGLINPFEQFLIFSPPRLDGMPLRKKREPIFGFLTFDSKLAQEKFAGADNFRFFMTPPWSVAEAHQIKSYHAAT